jgi:hypothetical protein
MRVKKLEINISNYPFGRQPDVEPSHENRAGCATLSFKRLGNARTASGGEFSK